MENFIHGAELLFTDPTALLLFACGLLGGLLFGCIPGVNLLTLGAVILPFTARMEAEHAIMLYSVIYCSGVFGGAITAILFNIPGSPENAPTAFDGYPMTLRGEAGRAIGAAVLCSALGGMFSALLMMFATPLIATWAVRNFGPPEIFGLICLGLAVSASVGAKTLWTGLLSISLGVLIGTIGAAPSDGTPRYAFGSYYLLAGVGFIPVVLGLFAVSEVFAQGAQRLAGSDRTKTIAVDFPSAREFWGLKFAAARSALIGFFAGILPGIGATLAAFLSYGEAARAGRKTKKFGQGELEGVVASETANNAATGAAMIPLLALGLPGGALTAMMLGVFQIHGMEPGPLIFITSADLVWVVFAAMFFANLAIFGLGYIQTRLVVHLLRIPFHLMAPAILLIATVGAFAVRNLAMDIWVMYIAGIAGYLLRRTGYSVAGLVLGLILGTLGEESLSKTMQLTQGELSAFLDRPIASGLIVLSILVLLSAIVTQLRGTAAPRSQAQSSAPSR